MTQQTEHDPGMVASSLRAKLQQFATGLTAKEQAAMDESLTGTGIEALSPALRAKAERAAAALTQEEGALARLLAQRALAGAAASEGADTTGHMVGLYDNGPGEGKARAVISHEARTWSVAGGVAAGVGLGVLAVVAVFTGGAAGTAAAGGAGLGLGLGLR
jgi:hypothetical protein